MFKIAEAFKRIDEEDNPRDYMEDLPSLNMTITKMIKSERYVFSADFLARGYPFERMAAEKMWQICCLLEEVTEEDIALCIFKNNPRLGGVPEAPGIWQSKTDDDVLAFAYAVDTNRNTGAAMRTVLTFSDSDDDK